MDDRIPLPPAPRIEPLPQNGNAPDVQALIDEFVMGPTVNVYTTMARRPDLLARCIPLGRALRAGRLSPRQREIVILRNAWLARSTYERAQHERVARAVGMTEDELRRITEGPEAGWEPAEEALLRAADECHHDATVSDETWASLAAHYGEAEIIEVVMLCGYYHLIAFFLNSLGVPVERDG